jgi:hypothetical protein
LNVKSALLNFIYIGIGVKHCCALANVRKTIFAQFRRRGAFIAYFPSENEHDNKKVVSAIGNCFQIFLSRICQSLYDVRPKAQSELYAPYCTIGNLVPHCQLLYTGWRCNFKGLSQDEGKADFSKNLSASLFNEGLSKEPNFNRIHLAGQYL